MIRAMRMRAGAASLSLVMSIGLVVAAAPPAEAAFAPPSYDRTIGGPGHAGVYAWGMATAVDGSILVGDYWNYAIRRYDLSGNLIQTFSSRGTGPGQNGAPHGVAVDPNDGSIYVADLNNAEIDKFDAAGNYLTTWSTFVPGGTVPFPYTPRLTVDSQSRVYQVSSHVVPPDFSNRIILRSSTGATLRIMGTNGSGNGQFGVIHGIAVGPSDELYVVDQGNHRIQVFDKDGNFLRKFASGASGPGGIPGDTRGITVDKANGWVYVVDSAESQIEKFDLQGNHLKTWGSEGTGNGQFRDGGREITLDQAGNVHVADFGNYRVNVYSPSGTFQRQYPNPVPAPPPGGFNQATDVAVNQSSGDVYVSDTFNHRVQRFNSAGDFVKEWGFRGTTDPFALNYPRGVAVDPTNGNVWINNTRQGNVKVYTANGGFVRTIGSDGTGPDNFHYAFGMWVDNSGRGVVTDSGNNRLRVVSQTGAAIWTKPCGTGTSGILKGCTGATTDSAGNIYAAAISERRIYKFSSSGTLLAKWNSSGSTGSLASPYDVQVIGSRLYVSDSNRNRIVVLDLNGNTVGAFGTKGSEHGQFNKPRGLAADSAGNLYVMDSMNERIEVFDTTP